MSDQPQKPPFSIKGDPQAVIGFEALLQFLGGLTSQYSISSIMNTLKYIKAYADENGYVNASYALDVDDKPVVRVEINVVIGGEKPTRALEAIRKADGVHVVWFRTPQGLLPKIDRGNGEYITLDRSIQYNDKDFNPAFIQSEDLTEDRE